MSITDKDAQRVIARALSDIRSTSYTQASARRAALVLAFQNIVRDFITDCRRALASRRTFGRNERDLLWPILLAALARIRVAYRLAGEDALTLVQFIAQRLRLAHATLVFRASDVTHRDAADDAFRQLLEGVDNDVADDIRQFRRDGANIDILVAGQIQRAQQASNDFLDAVDDQSAESDNVIQDIGLLLLGNDIDYGNYDIDRSDVTPIRILPFAAAMLAISETFNVMRSAQARVLERLGLVETAVWTLSGKHYIVDACDDLASRDVGYGRGRYPIVGWPGAPHPHCACYMTNARWESLQAWLRPWVP